MKKMIKSLFAVILCAVICFTAFSCGKEVPAIPENAVSVYKGIYLTTADYSYWLATAKYDYLYAMNDSIDNPEFWNSEFKDGKTHKEYFLEIVNENIKFRTVALALFEEYGLTLPESVVLKIDADIEEKEEYVGGAAMSRELADINLNKEKLKEVYINNAKYDLLYDFLYGTVGVELPSAEEKTAYYKENYGCVKLIAVYTQAKIEKEENGENKVDANGQYQFTELSDEEKAAQKAKLDTILASLEVGTSFEDCIKEYSEVDYSDYPNGLLYSPYDTERFGEDFLNKVISMKEGEYTVIEDGVISYIVKKYSLPSIEILTEKDLEQIGSISDLVTDNKYKEKFSELAKNAELKNDKISSIKVEDISRNSYY